MPSNALIAVTSRTHFTRTLTFNVDRFTTRTANKHNGINPMALALLKAARPNTIPKAIARRTLKPRCMIRTVAHRLIAPNAEAARRKIGMRHAGCGMRQFAIHRMPHASYRMPP